MWNKSWNNVRPSGLRSHTSVDDMLGFSQCTGCPWLYPVGNWVQPVLKLFSKGAVFASYGQLI